MEQNKSKPRFYILVGDQETWKVAIDNLQWGFKEKSMGNWRTLSEGEHLAFYVTNPIQKIIGFGQVTKKFKSDDFLWPDEKLFKKSLWNYRIKLRILGLVNNWNDGIEPPSGMLFNIGRKVIDEKIYDSLTKHAMKKWNTKFDFKK